ncbi:MAG: vWA domain-containing protein [Planctomycetota bacterium]
MNARPTAASLANRNCVITRSNRRRPASARRGAMLIMIAVMLLVFLMTVAFSIDIAYMHLSRAELRAATDAAAKAAATTLADTLDRDAAIRRGQQIAAANTVGGEPLRLAATDFAFGRSERQPNGKFRFGAASGSALNSVRVDGRRTSGSLSGAVPLFFGNVTGTSTFEPTMDATATYIERDITLVVDRSGSMRGSKIRDLRAAIAVFVNLLNSTPVEEQVGLASYNDRASEDVQLTRSLGAINDAMARMNTGGFTSISGGMSAGQAIANRGRPAEFVERTMIVMTDGRHNRGEEPANVARRLAADRVTIHAITFGLNADRARMQQVAALGGGRYFHADTGLQLVEVYKEIALTLGTIMTE